MAEEMNCKCGKVLVTVTEKKYGVCAFCMEIKIVDKDKEVPPKIVDDLNKTIKKIEETKQDKKLPPPRRIGRITISDTLMKDSEGLAFVFGMAKIAVVRCEHMYWNHVFEYIGLSPNFREIPVTEKPPRYNLLVKTENDLIVEVLVEEIK